MKRIFSTVLLVTLLTLTIFALQQTNAQAPHKPITSAVSAQ